LAAAWAGATASASAEAYGATTTVAAEPSPEAEPRHAERLVAVAMIRIARSEGGFRDAPGQALRLAVPALDADRDPLALAEQALGPAAQQQPRHQIFEHRAVPRDQRQSTGGASHRPLEVNQCSTGTSPLAIAKKLASRASEASRS
jgi:hypothetical protein